MDDRTKWNEKHAAERGVPAARPESAVVSALGWLGPGRGRALDVASGTGRHALDLAARGWAVEAWDLSPVGLGVLAVRCERTGVEVARREVDLTRGTPPDFEPFDLVLVVNYLDRDVYARLWELARPGGSVLVSTFTVDRPGSRPSERFCLGRGELARGLPGLDVIRCEEEVGRATLLARRAAD